MVKSSVPATVKSSWLSQDHYGIHISMVVKTPTIHMALNYNQNINVNNKHRYKQTITKVVGLLRSLTRGSTIGSRSADHQPKLDPLF